MVDPDYDPEERRQRYLETRQLKGRTKKTELTEAEKFYRGVDRENKKNRNRVSAEVSKQRQKELAQLRTSINEKRQKISNDLKAALEKLTQEAEQSTKGRIEKRDATLAKIAADKEAKLARFPAIPTNATGATYEALREKRSKLISKIIGEASSKEAVAKAEFSRAQTEENRALNTKKTFVRAVTSARQEELRTQLNAGIDKAKNRYETLKQKLEPK